MLELLTPNKNLPVQHGFGKGGKLLKITDSNFSFY